MAKQTLYRVTVEEIRVYKNEYFIYADDADEAQEKAEIGETDWENDARLQEVASRDVREVQEHEDQ